APASSCRTSTRRGRWATWPATTPRSRPARESDRRPAHGAERAGALVAVVSTPSALARLRAQPPTWRSSVAEPRVSRSDRVSKPLSLLSGPHHRGCLGCGGFDTVATPRWLSRECRAATERVEATEPALRTAPPRVPWLRWSRGSALALLAPQPPTPRFGG